MEFIDKFEKLVEEHLLEVVKENSIGGFFETFHDVVYLPPWEYVNYLYDIIKSKKFIIFYGKRLDRDEMCICIFNTKYIKLMPYKESLTITETDLKMSFSVEYWGEYKIEISLADSEEEAIEIAKEDMDWYNLDEYIIHNKE